MNLQKRQPGRGVIMNKLTQKDEGLKKRLETDKKLEQHTKRYIHIPFSWKSIGLFFAFIGSLGLAIANFFLIISTWKMLKLGPLNEESITGFHQLLIIYPLIGEYILIGLTLICLVALIKGGFDKVKRYGEEGLIIGLIGGLIAGLIGGLIAGLIGGLIIGLIGGLIIGLIAGLNEEFK